MGTAPLQQSGHSIRQPVLRQRHVAGHAISLAKSVPTGRPTLEATQSMANWTQGPREAHIRMALPPSQRSESRKREADKKVDFQRQPGTNFLAHRTQKVLLPIAEVRTDTAVLYHPVQATSQP